MKNEIFTVILLSSFICVGHAQNRELDRQELDRTVEWLEDKLTYNYYNVEDGEWWVNRFTYNDGSETITVKNISAPQIQAVSEKTYLQLNFKLEDLNPYTILVQNTPKNNGRLVKGKTIRVGAYDKAIHRSKNGKLSTNQSFLYFAIPDFFEDSVENYSQNIADKLSLAISLSTRVYAGSTAENLQILDKILTGRFVDSTATWLISQPFGNTYEIEVFDQNNDSQASYYLKPSTNGEQIQVTSIKPDQPASIDSLMLTTDGHLKYINANQSWFFVNENEIKVSIGTEDYLLIRDWTYAYSAPKYR